MESDGYVRWKGLLTVLVGLGTAIFTGVWAIVGSQTKAFEAMLETSSSHLQNLIETHAQQPHKGAVHTEHFRQVMDMVEKRESERFVTIKGDLQNLQVSINQLLDSRN